MNRRHTEHAALLIACFIALPPSAVAFDSGSTGADGELAPTSDFTVGLPADGVLNYSTINIPEGVTVSVTQNAGNTPAVILVQGDAVIDGTLDLSGVVGAGVTETMQPFRLDPPGSFRGGIPQGRGNASANGQGPGAGGGSINPSLSGRPCAAGGAGHFLAGQVGNTQCNSSHRGFAGVAYGSPSLVPLSGGSGGGGGVAMSTALSATGTGGGSGGGALLLAVGGTLTLNGQISVAGGDGGEGTSVVNSTTAAVSGGGGGSGGSARIVATSLSGTGTIDANGGQGGQSAGATFEHGGDGAPGRVKIEVEASSFTGAVTPAGVVTSSSPRPLFVANLPAIRITQIAGFAISSAPSGFADVVLPSTTTTPVTVQVSASQVPLGTTVLLSVNPTNGTIETQLTDGLAGDLTSSTATAQVTFPQGASTISASVNFTPPDEVAAALSEFANGEQIASVEVTAEVGRGAMTHLITASGNRYSWPSARLPLH